MNPRPDAEDAWRFVAPSWATTPGMEKPPLNRTLHLCRTATEACVGAVGQENPGLAVAIVEIDGILMARWGEATVFGPVIRQAAAPERALIEGLVIDTLEAGEKDVFLSCVDETVREALADRAVTLGHVLRQPGATPCPTLPDPFELFGARRIRAKAGASGGVMSFCELDPDEHLPLDVGDEILMATEHRPDGTTHVAYVDGEGWFVGLHGILPYALDDESVAAVSEVKARVEYSTWGRSWRHGRLRAMQFLIFEIPAEVDAFLADAKLPRGRGGAHL